MHINPKDQTKKENYKLLIGSILPRPIAFVTSRTPEGTINAAPFSFYNVVATDPPMIGISCARKPGNVMKDTALNIQESGEFVIQVVDTDNVKAVNDCSIDYPADMSEVTETGLTLKDSRMIGVPGVQEAKIRMECKLSEIIPMGGTNGAPSADFVIGEIVYFDIDDALYEEGRIDTEGLGPVGRLAGTTFGDIGRTYSMKRKSYEEVKDN
ncbi:flavin reductase family protein [Tuberibacillus sp. Marseille-P3662]|uniref:flavin reductase family protein n=1 Tax=Tuberibacillus sp. Marseille-P3662 TaxID=1965358 RepID=UPI000A1CF0AF|nr:flavin reductase family protein [Tuberibacillus sp. Marseille-P3662]